MGTSLGTSQKIALRTCIALVSLTALICAADELSARAKGRPTEQMKVNWVYAELNHHNEVEYSAGNAIMEIDRDAVMPHFGYKPCWYLRHSVHQVGS